MVGRRRVALGLGGFVWAASARAGFAEHRASAEDAHYTNHPRPGGVDCAACTFFEPARTPPDQCELVRGPISPDGSCDFFAGR